MSAPTLEDLIFRAEQELAPFDPADPSDEVTLPEATWREIVEAARARDVVVVTPEGERVARPLTVAQLAGVHALIKTLGRGWKARLRKIWQAPHLYASDDTSTALYSLRNTHGPGWLTKARTEDFK